jgi:hypothetical protein
MNRWPVFAKTNVNGDNAEAFFIQSFAIIMV